MSRHKKTYAHTHTRALLYTYVAAAHAHATAFIPAIDQNLESVKKNDILHVFFMLFLFHVVCAYHAWLTSVT